MKAYVFEAGKLVAGVFAGAAGLLKRNTVLLIHDCKKMAPKQYPEENGQL